MQFLINDMYFYILRELFFCNSKTENKLYLSLLVKKLIAKLLGESCFNSGGSVY